jgi:hypothetical protein
VPTLEDNDFLDKTAGSTPTGAIQFEASESHSRPAISTLQFAVTSGPARGSLEPGDNSESEFDGNMVGKNYDGPGGPIILESQGGDTGLV